MTLIGILPAPAPATGGSPRTSDAAGLLFGAALTLASETITAAPVTEESLNGDAAEEGAASALLAEADADVETEIAAPVPQIVVPTANSTLDQGATPAQPAARTPVAPQETPESPAKSTAVAIEGPVIDEAFEGTPLVAETPAVASPAVASPTTEKTPESLEADQLVAEVSAAPQAQSQIATSQAPTPQQAPIVPAEVSAHAVDAAKTMAAPADPTAARPSAAPAAPVAAESVAQELPDPAPGERPRVTQSVVNSALPDERQPAMQNQAAAPQATPARTVAGVDKAPAQGAPAVGAAPVAIVHTQAPSALTVVAPAAEANTHRAVAAQVSPVVVNIAQRPMGTHQLTITVNPDSLGPVTVRAHISVTGEVQVELHGGTDAGRDALKAIVADLRRDLAAVMPQATLSLGSATSQDAASADRGAQPQAGGDADQGSRERRDAQPENRMRQAAERLAAHARNTTMPAAAGAGLDIIA